jgi:membrane protease YdiL (CAAX protease family)
VTVRASSRRRTLRAVVLLVAFLVTANLARSALVPDGAHFAFNLTIAAVALLIGRYAGTTADELGLAREHLAAGLRLGAMAAVLVTVVVASAAFVPSLADAFDDSRVDVGLAGLVLNVVVVIPLGTVLVEELVFRGVLQALLTRLTSTAWAVAWGALLFGLWHVFPAWVADDGNEALEDVGKGAAVLGTFVATTAAGVLFGLLRARSKSLAAPVLAHLATNVAPFVAAWVLAR